MSLAVAVTQMLATEELELLDATEELELLDATEELELLDATEELELLDELAVPGLPPCVRVSNAIPWFSEG